MAQVSKDVDQDEALRMPTTKAEAQAILKRFGIRGVKVWDIGEDRIFVLTNKRLHADNTMRRDAQTVVIVQLGDLIEAVGPVVGWVVDDERDKWTPA